MKKYLIVIVLAACAILWMAYFMRPDLLGITPGQQDFPPRHIQNRAQPMPKQMRGKSGTAFSPAQGLFVTNSHVVEDCISIIGVQGKRRFTVKVVTVTEDQDLALLRSNDMNARFVGTVPISMQDTLAEGNRAYISGFSGDVLAIKEAKILQANLALPFTIVAANDRPVKKTLQAVGFQSTAYRGDSGAPLVDTAGRVVAVVSRGMDRQEGKAETRGAAIKLGQLRALLAPYATVYSTRDFHLPDVLSRSARERLLNATVQLRCRLE